MVMCQRPAPNNGPIQLSYIGKAACHAKEAKTPRCSQNHMDPHESDTANLGKGQLTVLYVAVILYMPTPQSNGVDE